MRSTFENVLITPREKLETYIMLFASQNITAEDEEKRRLFKPALDTSEYDAICREFDRDNDIGSIQKILDGIKQLRFTTEDLETLFNALKNLCKACRHSSSVDHFRLKQLNNLIFSNH